MLSTVLNIEGLNMEGIQLQPWFVEPAAKWCFHWNNDNSHLLVIYYVLRTIQLYKYCLIAIIVRMIVHRVSILRMEEKEKAEVKCCV